MADKDRHHQDTITTVVAGKPSSSGPTSVIVGWMLVLLSPSIVFVIYFIISGKLF